MKVRKFFEEDLLNTKPRDPSEKAAFGRREPGGRPFGRENSPHFGGSLHQDERGVAAIEYAMICAVIALAILAALGRLGGGVSANWNTVDKEIGNSIEFRT